MAGLLLAGCGYFGGSPHSPVAHPAAKAAHRVKAADPAAYALAAMVEAVGPSSGTPPVELRFSIRDRPQVGQEDEIDYALIPEVAGVDTVRVAFGSVSEELKVVNRGPLLAGIKPAVGVPIFGSVTVRPLKAGLFTLTGAVGVESSGQSVVWPFSIPIIVGEGPAQTAANRP